MVFKLFLTGLAVLHTVTAQQGIPTCLVRSLPPLSPAITDQLTTVSASLSDTSRHQPLCRRRPEQAHALPLHDLQQPSSHAEPHRQPGRGFLPQGRVCLPASLRTCQCRQRELFRHAGPRWYLCHQPLRLQELPSYGSLSHQSQQWLQDHALFRGGLSRRGGRH